MAHPSAKCELAESRFCVQCARRSHILPQARAQQLKTVSSVRRCPDTGLTSAGAGTFVKLQESTLTGNSLSGVLVCEGGAAELQQCKATFGEGHGIEVRSACSS